LQWQKGAAPINLCPMRLLDRYLFRELFTPLAFCLAGLQSLIIFVTIFGDADRVQEAKLHFFETIEYAAAASMDYVTIVLPVSLLAALLWALTHHARHNEITAMRAAGISLWRICVPYFIIGLIGSGALFALNELVVPRSLDWADNMLNRYSKPVMTASEANSLQFTNERDHSKWVVSHYHATTGEMLGVELDWTLSDGSMYHLYANRAVRTNDVWTFYHVQELSQSNAAAGIVPLLKTDVLAKPEFDETSREIRAEIKVNGYLNSGGLHNPNLPFRDILTYLRWHPNLSPAEKGKLLTDLQERVALPVTCLVVAFIAIPFGAAPGRRNLFFGVAGSIFICLTYFVLQRVSLAFGASGTWPAWLAAWLPNLFFGLLGLILTARIR
jgi:lipopolysaccharide export system permease protein